MAINQQGDPVINRIAVSQEVLEGRKSRNFDSLLPGMRNWSSFILAALLVAGCIPVSRNSKIHYIVAGSRCSVHDHGLAKKQVPFVFILCLHISDYWQQYTLARDRLFPNSGDDIYVDFDKIADTRKFEKHGWKGVATNTWIYACPICDEQKEKWMADHPPRKPKPAKVP